MTKRVLIGSAYAALAIVAGLFWFLKQRDAEFPYIYNPANFVSADEIRQIEQIVRGRGERYLISINIVNTNKAGATTGQGSLRPRSGRSYSLVRTAEVWRIEAVGEWKN